MFHFLKIIIFFITALAVVTVGCSGGGSFGGGIVGASPKNPPAAQPVEVDIAQASKAKDENELSQQEFEKMSALPTEKFFDEILANADNMPVMVEGRLFETVSDKVLECQEYLFDLSANFSTLGELFESAEVYSPADIHFEDFENSLDVMEKAHEKGSNFFKKKSMESDKLDDMSSKNSGSGGGGGKLRLHDRLHLEIDEFDCNSASQAAACCSSVSAAVCGQQPRLCALHSKICMVMGIKAKKACEDKQDDDVDDGTNDDEEGGE